MTRRTKVKIEQTKPETKTKELTRTIVNNSRHSLQKVPDRVGLDQTGLTKRDNASLSLNTH
jgi:hypothetical protein